MTTKPNYKQKASEWMKDKFYSHDIPRTSAVMDFAIFLDQEASKHPECEKFHVAPKYGYSICASCGQATFSKPSEDKPQVEECKHVWEEMELRGIHIGWRCFICRKVKDESPKKLPTLKPIEKLPMPVNIPDDFETKLWVKELHVKINEIIDRLNQ